MTYPDLEAADRICRLAFGTFFGLPDPAKFRGDGELIRTRWATDPATALVAECDGTLVGSALGTDWGSVFIIGPITVQPDSWSQGIGRALMPPLLDLVAARPVSLTALFTHPASTKHIRLYESYGFTAQFLTGVFSKPVAPATGSGPDRLYSKLSAADQMAALAACRAISDAVYPGLDLSREIRGLAAQRLGDTLLLEMDGRLAGFAVCHFGPGTEAGSGRLYVKFAAVRPGAAADFEALLARCEALAAAVGAQRIIAGANNGRRVAYRLLQSRGYRADLNGIAMHRPDAPGYNRPDVFVIDDWR